MRESPPGRGKRESPTEGGGLWLKAREAYLGLIDKGNVLEGMGLLVKS